MLLVLLGMLGMLLVLQEELERLLAQRVRLVLLVLAKRQGPEMMVWPGLLWHHHSA